ncbi:MAG: hypothetical protein H7A46_05420 [Verrucomicrobiales bacterium]|nr:hypothetical protein [Verrucomicrobiales bacterium]
MNTSTPQKPRSIWTRELMEIPAVRRAVVAIGWTAWGIGAIYWAISTVRAEWDVR